MSKLKVLILEDDVIIALHIENILKRLSCEIIGKVDNCNDALKMSSKNGIDLLIADIKIYGEINGIETAKKLHDIYKCEVLFLTALVDNKTLEEASNIQSLGYLIKPFRENELLAILKMEIKRDSIKKESSLQIDENYLYKIKDHQLYYKKEKIDLTTKESKLFYLLIRNINKLITCESIDKTIYDDSPISEKRRKKLIFKLKDKVPYLNIELISDKGLLLKIE